MTPWQVKTVEEQVRRLKAGSKILEKLVKFWKEK